jgi:hypothetical protein
MTTWGEAVGDGEGDGVGVVNIATGDAGSCVFACGTPQAAMATARTGATIRMAEARIVARGFYEFWRR